MRSLVVIALFILSTAASADDWTLLSTAEPTRTYITTPVATGDSANAFRFQLKTVFINRMDMMGLQYDASLKTFVVSCEARTVLFRQQFLLDGDEVVWTFPESRKEQPAHLELAPEVLPKICPPAADAERGQR